MSVCLLAVVVAAGLAGCTEEEKPVTLPSLSPTTATPTSTTGMTDREQIRTIYADYVANWYDASDLPAEERRQFLGRWTVDPQRSAIVDGLADSEEEHLRRNGESVPHIFELEVDGETAVVNDCSDDRKVTLENTETGKVKRFDRNWYVVEFKRLQYGWRISDIDVKEEPCVGR